jgi:hypothetical protein
MLSENEMEGYIRNLQSQGLYVEHFVKAVIDHYFIQVLFHDMPTEYGLTFSEELQSRLTTDADIVLRTKEAYEKIKHPQFKEQVIAFFKEKGLPKENAENLFSFIQFALKKAGQYYERRE